MQILLNLLLIVQILAALAMVGLILMQHGKGADMGASFGSGASGSLFGATGSANFLSRSTAIAATLFFACTLALAYFGNRPGDGGLMSKLVGSEKAVGSATSSIVPGAKAPVASVPSGIAQIPGGASSAPTSTPVKPAPGATTPAKKGSETP